MADEVGESGGSSMNQIQRKNPFWSLMGPLLGYLGIRWIVEFCAEFVITFPYMMGAYKDLVRENGYPAMQDVMGAYMEAMQPAYEIVVKYSIEITAAASLAAMILTVFLFRRDRKLEKQCGIVIKQLDLSRYWTIALFGIAGSIASECLMLMAQFAFYDMENMQGAVMYTVSLPVEVIALGIVIPLSEELMFRGILFKRFRERQGFAYSMICTSILYALMHSGGIQIAYSFLSGMILAYVYEKFGSLKAPVLLHVLLNTSSVLFSEFGLFEYLLSEPMLMAGIVILGALICSMMFVHMQKIVNSEE